MSKTVLTHPILGQREFEAEHAARILALSDNGGWTKKDNDDSGSNKDSKRRGKREEKDNPGNT